MEKIDFIICTNDVRHFEEAVLYINSLNVPPDHFVNVLEIQDADSIFSGYNEGMHASDAKYKIYMHHDVRIINKNFLYIMLDKFSDPSVGMMGVVGSTKLSEEPWLWDAGCIVETRVDNTNYINFSKYGGDTFVKQIDGLLIATQYDLPWREDLFDGWDVYDCSQCCEFLKAGYKIIVPEVDKPLCLHDCGIIDTSEYRGSEPRQRFIQYYKDMFD